ncbi:MAG: hypothetical protein EOP61_30735 [Sphingomonadales bacterium]|nr:MAG: hypothetical protein EOP61_30735 [Sphingomonadales bacterium]
MDDFTQTAFVIRDLERSIEHWHAIGAGPFDIIDLDPLFADPAKCPLTYRGKPSNERFRIATGFLGKNQIELIQPTNDAPGVFGDGLRERGEGMHHMQTLVRPVDAELFDRTAAGYTAHGLELIATIMQPNGRRVAFFDSLSRLGFLLELVERNERVVEMIIAQHQRHLDRDQHPMIMRY